MTETSLTRSDDAHSVAVKWTIGPAGHLHRMVAITILLTALSFLILTAPALGADRLGNARFERPPPNVTRQVDRLSRSGAADPLARRQLQDQLRHEPPSAGRSSAERTLERLPNQGAAEPRPLPVSPEPAPLPSSLPAGIEGAGGGGFVPPPGNRGQQR